MGLQCVYLKGAAQKLILTEEKWPGPGPWSPGRPNKSMPSIPEAYNSLFGPHIGGFSFIQQKPL